MRIAINGYLGQMGQVINDLAEEKSLEVIGRIDHNGGLDKNNREVLKSIWDLDEEIDVIIDFSKPRALDDMLDYAKENRIALVIGTTGYEEDELKKIEEYSEYIPIFHSSNMSLGVNLMLDLVKKASSVLKDFDIEVLEAHHNKKIDAPSGTAFMILDAINEVFNNEKEYVHGRHTKTEAREKKEIGVHAIRGGTIVGEHTALFAGTDEIIEIKHTALSKKVFAEGALAAAEFLKTKENGLYNMNDMIE